MSLFGSAPNKKRTVSPRGFRPRLTARSPFAIKEAYNSIRTKLIFTGKGEKCPIFVVTSPFAANGKSTNAVSLAVSFAAAEQHVLLIDADMRKPTVHRYFGLECRNGLSELLAGLTSEINLRRTDNEYLSVLTAGQIPPNPAELLGSKQAKQLLDYARQHFDYVIIDTPPINLVTDASVLAEQVTGYVLVVQSGKTRQVDVRVALSALREVNATIVGLLLNDPNNKARERYSYRHNKAYRSEQYAYSNANGMKRDL